MSALIRTSMLLICVVALAIPAIAQESPVVLDDWEGSGHQYLNSLIAADTAANGWVANRVYVLKRNGIYYVNATFRVSEGHSLRLRSDYDMTKHYKPTIYLVPTGTGGSPTRPPGNFIDLRGQLWMTNILLSGYYEPVDSNLNNIQGGLINIPTAGAGGSMYIDSCILKTTNGNHIRTDGAVSVLKLTNSVISDMGFLGRSNLGAGKGIDVRNVSVDSLIVENCTFVNWQDRIIRHFQSTAPINYMRFNRNTLVNGMSYHGMLSLGQVGSKMIITNNLLIDNFSLGNDTDAVRQAEFTDSGEKDAFGFPRMTWVIANPNDTTDWVVSNNYYGVSDSGQSFFDDFASAGVTGEGTPLTYKINERLHALGRDTLTAFKKVTLQFDNVPAVMNTMNRWYRSSSGGNKTKGTSAFTESSEKGHWTFDFDRRLIEYYYDTLDCDFRMSEAPVSSDGLGVGDQAWSYLGAPLGVQQTDALPTAYALSQNFPNPFNPTTTFTFSLPLATDIRLEVFDVLGRVVATLANGRQNAGSYTVEFDATHFGTGVYFYRLTTPDRVMTKRMVLLK